MLINKYEIVQNCTVLCPYNPWASGLAAYPRSLCNMTSLCVRTQDLELRLANNQTQAINPTDKKQELVMS